MAIATAAELVAALRKHSLLKPEQLDDVARQTGGKQLDARTLAQKLLQAGSLTPYQVNQLLQGKGQELVLGSYLVLERLGEGGMGQVFKARHQGLGRVVALKLIHKERLGNPQAVKRFQREMQVAGKLNHPNIVLGYDADQIGNTHFFTMEFVEGTDLNKLVKEKGRLPVQEACDYIRQAALGLQHAHERGLVHRDIKPHNLLLAKNGTVKILDMGLARMQADEDTSTLTKEGSVVGTLDYVSPEQAMNSHKVDIRADLYSLGCTFYFLLTGQVPFPGGTAMEKLSNHAFHIPTPVEQLRPDIPPGVAAIVRKLMSKKPEERFQTPAELAVVLAKGQMGAIQNGKGRKRHRLMLLVGGIAAVAGIGLLLALLSGPEKHVVNSIGMKLSYIPPGKFLMGSTPEEIERFKKEPHSDEPGVSLPAEGPQHEVRITKGFYMGVYEVRQSEYEKVMGKNPSAFKGPDYPVEQVNWDEAVEFCKKLSDLPEEKRAGRIYRLPTEAEWEYACRAGKQTFFHWSDSLSSRQANFNGTFPFGGAEKGPSIGKTTKVGSYPPNAWGLYDMHGNVSEWCLDGARTYTPNPVDDPRGPESAGGSPVLRGGSWLHDAWNCRSALRQPFRSSHRYHNVGFRVVLVR
jgi:serine/threonine protein kinase